MTYTLAGRTACGWKSVSKVTAPQARQNAGRSRTPTEEVHLIAAPFTEYSRDAGAVKAMAFLRKADQALADRYLDATGNI